MATVDDWHEFRNAANGKDHLKQLPPQASQPETTTTQPAVRAEPTAIEPTAAKPIPRFGTSPAYIEELDAQAREDTIMLALELRHRQVVALYNGIDRDIEEAVTPLTQARLMGWAAVVEEEINNRTRQYLRRGSGTTHETLTVHSTRQPKPY
ncbi:hypothetical protein [Labedaea rhizosphaerae]|nr:hypothetical protein [Labedaea rhizosphaerae]